MSVSQTARISHEIAVSTSPLVEGGPDGWLFFPAAFMKEVLHGALVMCAELGPSYPGCWDPEDDPLPSAMKKYNVNPLPLHVARRLRSEYLAA